MRETEKVGVALRVLPKDVDHSIVRALRRCPDYETLKDHPEEEIRFISDLKGVDVAAGPHPVARDRRHGREDESEDEEGRRGRE